MSPQSLPGQLRVCLGSLILVTVWSCSPAGTPPPVATSDDAPLFARRVRYRLTVCYELQPAADPLSELETLLAAAPQPISRVPTIDGTQSEMVVAADLDFFEPEGVVSDVQAESKVVEHLSPEDRERLPRLDSECVLDWSYPGSDPFRGLERAIDLTHQLALSLKGIVRDDTTGQYFSAGRWKERRSGNWHAGTPNVSRQMVIQISTGSDGLLSAHTRGMAKFGLPDVVISDFPTSEMRSVGNTLNVFTQAMIEGLVDSADGEFDIDMRALRHPDVRDPQVSNFEAGATGVLLVTLQTSRGHGPRTSTLTFDRGTGPDRVARMTNVLSRAFGVRDSVVKTVHDEEVQAASAAARKRLPELREEFNAGLETGELLLVKAPFKTPDDENEYMWVEVTAWTDGEITGHLMNEPYSVPDLQAGQLVEVQDSSVFDFIRKHADGSTEGNTTAKLLQPQASGQSDN